MLLQVKVIAVEHVDAATGQHSTAQDSTRHPELTSIDP
jgi:hypothetical protein